MVLNKRSFIRIFLTISISFVLLLSACSEVEEPVQNDESILTNIIIEDVYVEMKDGVKLATRVYRPNDEQKYPVLLARTTYNSGAFNTPDGGSLREVGERLANKGYVVVVQDVRGLFGSEGNWRLFMDDAEDGYQTVLWLNEQSWSNGKVGAIGASSHGMTANLLATTNPPGLEAAFIQIAPSQLYEEVVAEGGVYRQELATRWLFLLYYYSAPKLVQRGEMDQETYAKIEEANQDFYELYSYTPLNKFPHLSDSDIFNSIFEHYIKDDYYDYYDISAHFSDINVPIYYVGGWFDIFEEGTMKNYLGIQQNGGNGAKGNQKLLMGPWAHPEFINSASYVDSSFFEGDEIDLITEMEHWFDYWLKGIDTGIMDEDSIKYYKMGTNEWKTTNEWPLAGVKEEKWYFNDEKSNSASSLNDSLLSNSQPSSTTKDQFIYDPANPIFTIGGRNIYESFGAGPMDQRPAEENSLTYTSEPLTEPLEIGGTVKATLYVSSDAIDTDFTVKLTDVSPDGASHLLNEGALRMRFREGLDKEVFMEEGKVYEIEVNLNDISHVFNEGHRIRVAVSSSNFPRFDRNSNTGNPLGVDSVEDFVIAENAVHIGPEYPSHITLPVVKK